MGHYFIQNAQKEKKNQNHSIQSIDNIIHYWRYYKILEPKKNMPEGFQKEITQTTEEIQRN